MGEPGLPSAGRHGPQGWHTSMQHALREGAEAPAPLPRLPCPGQAGSAGRSTTPGLCLSWRLPSPGPHPTAPVLFAQTLLPRSSHRPPPPTRLHGARLCWRGSRACTPPHPGHGGSRARPWGLLVPPEQP